jgi:hypothetical protein
MVMIIKAMMMITTQVNNLFNKSDIFLRRS